MRVCPACGKENADTADFCSCGEYLRWEPTSFQKAVTPAPPAAEAASHVPAAGSPPAPVATPAPLADPNVTLAPGALPATPPNGAFAGQVPFSGAGAPSGPSPAPPAPEAPPGAAALSLRLPDGDAAEGIVATSVEPGQRALVLGLIRNQADVVDNFDLSVRGLPEGWWTITPATAYLVPYGTAGQYEQEVQIHLHPPRNPQAQARAWTFEVVAVSRAFGQEVAAAPATLTIGPYFDIATELRPERGSGRLKARFRLVVRNKANARTEVALSAEDTDGECQFRFAEPSVAIEPGNALECPFTVFPPRQIWLGRPLDRRFQVSAVPLGVELTVPQQPRMAVFRQRPWLPWWLAIVLPILLVLAVLIYSLMPKPTTVPKLVGQKDVFSAQKLLNKVGLQLSPKPPEVVVDAKKPAGSIADQSPPAGTKASKSTLVTVKVYGGSGQQVVPNVVGLTPGLADQTLRSQQLTLGVVSPQPLDPAGKIVSQIPLAGTSVAGATPVNVFMAPKGVKPGAAGAAALVAGGAAGAAGATAANGAQSLSAGTKANAAVLAQAGGGQIVIPALKGDPAAGAATLNQLGLVPVAKPELADVPAGQVAGTLPPAGTKVAKGAQVIVLVSSGSPELSFDDGQSVKVVDPSTGKPVAVVPGAVPGQPQVEASWSPDGTHLIYSQGGRLFVFQPNVSGAQPAPIEPATPGVTDRDPVFAPVLDRALIAFIRRSSSGARLCFATIGKYFIAPDCVGVAGFDLGGPLSWARDGSAVLALGTKNGGRNFGVIAFVSNVPFSTQASNWRGALQTDATMPGQGVISASFSPDGRSMALISNIGSQDFHLFLGPVGNFDLSKATNLGVRACQVTWRSDSKELAVMDPSGPCTATATGTLYTVDPSQPQNLHEIVPNGAHAAWQSVPLGG